MCSQCLNCEKRSGGTLEARRRRRENRVAEGGRGNGRGCPPPNPLGGPGERHELKTNLVHFVAARRTLIATICLIYVSLNTAVVHSHYCFERCKKYNNVITANRLNIYGTLVI